MTIYNNRLIPHWMRIDKTQTKVIDDKHSGRRDAEWGVIRITHPEDTEFHLQDEEERKEDDG